MKPTIAVDFDGVLNNYTGWKGDNDLSTPRPGAKEFLETLSKDYTVVIFSVRKYPYILKWLKDHDLDRYVDDVTSIKPSAVAYVDDRGICFEGDYEEVLEKLKDFKPHWKK